MLEERFSRRTFFMEEFKPEFRSSIFLRMHTYVLFYFLFCRIYVLFVRAPSMNFFWVWNADPVEEIQNLF
jgi:hypothetical protein